MSSIILKKLIFDATASAGSSIDSAVVTVPAYFSDRQKFATRAACDMAGIQLLRLLPESTSAAISFGLGEDKESSKTIMVFDLGGGTFDISILNVSRGIFLEIAKGGDMWLGGDNIDYLLVDYVYRQVEKSENCGPIKELVAAMPPGNRARFIAEIREKCERAKIQLSAQDSSQVELFGILRDRDGRLLDIDVPITRAEFDQIIAPMVTRLAELTRRLMHEIRFEPSLIDTVLMVGGSSLIPAIQQEIKLQFGEEKVMIHPRPMTAVAEGAAWMAAHLAGTATTTTDAKAPEMSMMHSMAHDYYLQLSGGQRHLLVSRNTPLPFSIQHKFRFATENQSLARLRICNEVDGVLESVGELWFHADAETVSMGKREELTLHFSVDEDNIISMEAVSVTNPRRKVAAQIARGGLVTMLYGDLERSLSEIVACCKSGTSADDALELSKTIVSGILEVSDPRTGRTRPEVKRQVQTQIANLGHIFKKHDAPLAKLNFVEMALEAATPILSPDEEVRLKSISSGLHEQLESLTDEKRINQLFENLAGFWNEVPVAAELARAQNIAEIAGQSELARSIRTKMQELIDASIGGKKDRIAEIRENLAAKAFMNFSFDDTPSRRFDRDVTL
ncbi:MAG: Hsp70 family protein [Bdellovibrionales bacterium]|nr:Hsp70 family protein [Bdellovibrionales bacterium]